MPSFVRSCLLLSLLSLAFVGIAAADAGPDDLNINLAMNCPPSACFVDPFVGGQPGNYAAGSADFNFIGYPWSYIFQTPLPMTWTYNDQTGQYNATFGTGGSFLLNGPGGLTFTGEITGGTAYSTGGPITFGVNLSFSGLWNNGEQGSGSFVDSYSEQFGPQATLIMQTSGSTPEPSSLILLGTGLVGALGWKKRLAGR